jgi:hypothetical protein
MLLIQANLQYYNFNDSSVSWYLLSQIYVELSDPIFRSRRRLLAVTKAPPGGIAGCGTRRAKSSHRLGMFIDAACSP